MLKSSLCVEQELLNSARENQKLLIIRDMLQQPNGGIPDGKLPSHDWAEKFLGETFHKVILATNGIEKLGEKGYEFTVLGGWCAVRTQCLKEISEGKLTDYISGETKTFTTTFEVARWLQSAIAFDQIIEAVGKYNGTEYVAISEERMWTEKVVHALERYFSRKLHQTEKDEIQIAIHNAEEKRYECTKRYLEYASGKKINLLRVVDRDIYKDLELARTRLFRKLNISLSDLTKSTIDRITNRKQILEVNELENFIKSINSYIKSYSLIWMMYTGPYLSILKKKGFVKTPKAIVIESWNHFSGIEIEAKTEFNYRLFGQNNGENNQLQPHSINEDIAFIAMDEPSDFRWKRHRRTRKINKVPNIHNVEKYVHTLSVSPTITSLDLSKNEVYQECFNFIPYKQGFTLLNKMQTIASDYRTTRKNMLDKQNSASNMKSQVAKLRSQKEHELKEIAVKALEEMKTMLQFVFQLSQ